MSEPSDFVTVALLYKKHTRSGNTIWFGRWNGVRLYLFATEDRQPKDARPDFELAIRRDDYYGRGGDLP